LRGLLTGEVGVVVLEDFVETVFEEALEGVANQGGREAFPDAAEALLFEDEAERGGETSVFLWVDLEREKKSRLVLRFCFRNDWPACYIWRHPRE
jgi:hypothetical protein